MSESTNPDRAHGLFDLGDIMGAGNSSRLVEHLGHLAHFIGVPIEKWQLAEWQRATLMAIEGVIGLEQKVLSIRLANALTQPPPKRGRGRPKKEKQMTLRELGGSKKQPTPKHRIGFLPLTDDEVRRMVAWADDAATDAEFCRMFLQGWEEIIPIGALGRRDKLKSLERALPKRLSHYRKKFSLPRKNDGIVDRI